MATRAAALLAVFVFAASASAGINQDPAEPVRDRDHVGPVGWPVWPVDQQHPVRGGFLDPRPGAAGPTFHNGIDISVRDDQPEPGHPWQRTHRVYALEPGVVETAADVGERTCSGRLVRVGRFTYSHVDPVGTVEAGQRVEEGDVVGWTCAGQWHLHLTERAATASGEAVVNPLRAGGRLRPYVDKARPVVRGVEFFDPDAGAYTITSGTAYWLTSGSQLLPTALRGRVDIRVQASDPQSFVGWFASLPFLRTEHTPYELHVSVRRVRGRVVWQRVVHRADMVRPREAPLAPRFSPGTTQNMPASNCLRVRTSMTCSGELWFSVGGAGGALEWDTLSVANGAYDVCVTARDTAGNSGRRCTRAKIAN